MQEASTAGSLSVMVSHCYPNGSASPSCNDQEHNRGLGQVLAAFDVTQLADRLIAGATVQDANDPDPPAPKPRTPARWRIKLGHRLVPTAYRLAPMN